MTVYSEKTPRRKSSKGLLACVVILWIGVGLGVIGMFALVLSGGLPLIFNFTNNAEEIDPFAPVGIGEHAFEFQLSDIHDQTINLTELRNKVVVLNFWTTTCGPCIREMPMLQKFHEQYFPELVILGIDIQESPDEVKAFLDQFNLSYGILLDISGDVGKKYQVYALPNTFFLDREGIIRYHQIGIISEEQFTGYLRELGIEK